MSMNPVVLLDAVTDEGMSQAIALDYRRVDMIYRNLSCITVAGDTVIVEVSCDGGNSFVEYARTDKPLAIISLVGPFTHVRVNKVGANGVANVRGIL